MIESETLIEWASRVMPPEVRPQEVSPGVFEQNTFNFKHGTTAQALRSGVDGPHAELADRLCNLNGRLYE